MLEFVVLTGPPGEETHLTQIKVEALQALVSAKTIIDKHQFVLTAWGIDVNIYTQSRVIMSNIVHGFIIIDDLS